MNSLQLSSIYKSASQAVLGRMQLAPHATRRTRHGASRLVQAMSAWSLKTRHAPSRHCRDARVYGHTTTALHEIEYISPIEYTPPPPIPSERRDFWGVGTAYGRSLTHPLRINIWGTREMIF